MKPQLRCLYKTRQTSLIGNSKSQRMSVCLFVRSELQTGISQHPEELETWFKHKKWSVGVSQHDGVDSSHHDHHQDDQEAQEHPPSKWMFLIALMQYWPMCYIFLETCGKIQYIGGDSRYHGCHHDDQEAQKHPPSTKMFLMALLHYSYVSDIFGMFLW